MIASSWLFIGVVAFLITILTVLVPDDGWAIVLGIAGFLSWAFFAYGALEVTVIRNAVTYQYSLPVVTFFGVIMSLIPGYVALTGPANVITEYRKGDPDEL
jgi:hypothetical protein